MTRDLAEATVMVHQLEVAATLSNSLTRKISDLQTLAAARCNTVNPWLAYVAARSYHNGYRASCKDLRLHK